MSEFYYYIKETLNNNGRIHVIPKAKCQHLIGKNFVFLYNVLNVGVDTFDSMEDAIVKCEEIRNNVISWKTDEIRKLEDEIRKLKDIDFIKENKNVL